MTILLCKAIITRLTTFLSQFESVCTLCAPMIGKALNDLKKDVTILDIDERFSTEKGYLNWNIYKPAWINKTFDVIFCDPPFFNVSLSQLFKAIRMLSHNNFEQKLMIGYLTRRSDAVLGSFHLFHLLPTGYFPYYVTVQKTERNQIEIFSNIEYSKAKVLLPCRYKESDNGWTSFDKVSTAKDGTKTYSYEMWMVEKITGEWKLVAASMHFYKQP